MTRVFAAISLAALLLVVDSTGLKGSWDFDITWTPQFLLPMAGSDSVTLFDALNKQLGLKLEEQKLPSPVIVVDQVNRAPTDNPPDIQVKLPPLPPAEFEVADIKPTMPGARPLEGRFGFLPGPRQFAGFPAESRALSGMERPSPRGDRGSAEMARFRPIRHHCESASRHRSGKRRAGGDAWRSAAWIAWGSAGCSVGPGRGDLIIRRNRETARTETGSAEAFLSRFRDRSHRGKAD